MTLTTDEVILRRLARLPDLTIPDKSMLLLALKDFPRSKSIAAAFQKDLISDSWKWVVDGQLEEIALRLLAIHHYDSTIIDGTCVAYLAKRLVSVEEKVGGPYDIHSPHAIFINALLAQLFTSFGTPLPNITHFLHEALRKYPEYAQTPVGAWSLSWPHSIVPRLKSPQQTSQPSERIFIQDTVARTCLERKPSLHQPTQTQAETSSLNSVARFVHSELQLLDEPLKHTSLNLWKLITRVDARQEISMLATFFADSLRHPLSAQSRELSHQLGVANFYTWMAYTIYDDFIDEEGRPIQLPAANSMHRSAVKYYQVSETESRPIEYELIHTVFNAMDRANTWEIENARFIVNNDSITITTLPDYGDGMILADRARAHILGPLIIGHLHPLATKPQQAKLEQALCHYLIARQLNDDIHDWSEDLANGHISFVVAYLLKALKIGQGEHSLTALHKKIQQFFWQTGMEEITSLITQHVTLGKRFLQQSRLVTPHNSFTAHTFRPIEQSAQQSLQIHRNHMQFLQTYKTTQTR